MPTREEAIAELQRRGVDVNGVLKQKQAATNNSSQVTKEQAIAELRRRGVNISTDTKPAGNGAVDFTQSNKNLSDAQKIRESGAMDSPFSKMLDLSPAGGVMDAAASMASSAIAEPVAGIAGLAGLPFGAERAAKNVEDTRSLIARQPRTPVGKAIIGGIGSAAQSVGDALGNPLEKARSFLGDAAYDAGGPALGAIASAVPDALTMAAGGAASKFIPSVGAKILNKAASKSEMAGDAFLAQAKSIQDQFKSGSFEMNTADPALKQVADILMRDDPAEIAAMLKGDPKFFDAVKAIGINKTAPASYSSDNPAYRGIEQGLAAQAANPLGILGDDFIKATQEKASELITKYKGSRDKAGIDKKFKDEITGAIEELARVEEIGYDKMRAALSGGTKAKTENIDAHIKSMMKSRNNDITKLPKFLQEIYSVLKPKVTVKRETITAPDGYVTTGAGVKQRTPPTVDILEDQRKAVGRAYNKNQGVYSDEDSHMLGEAYAALRADADSVYQEAGMLDELKALNETTQLRKELEANSVDLLGKNLAKSITFKVGAAMKGITGSGGVETFTCSSSMVYALEIFPSPPPAPAILAPAITPALCIAAVSL